MCLEPVPANRFRFQRTGSWIQAIIRSNDGIRPYCAQVNCNRRAQHGAHMSPVYDGNEEVWLYNVHLSKRQNVAPGGIFPVLVIPLCSSCHGSGPSNVNEIWDVGIEEQESLEFWPDVVLIDNQMLADTITDENSFQCPGCLDAESAYPRWYYDDETSLPIDSCDGCGCMIHSDTAFTNNKSRCNCDEMVDVDEFGLCRECRLEVEMEESF